MAHADIVVGNVAVDQPADFAAGYAAADVAADWAIADTAVELAVAGNSDADNCPVVGNSDGETDAEQAVADIPVAGKQQPNFLMTSADAVVADRHHPRSAAVADTAECCCYYWPPAEILE